MEPDYGSDHSVMPLGAFSPSRLTLLFPSLLLPGITPGSLSSPRQGRGLPGEPKGGTVMVCCQKKEKTR